MSSTGKRDNLRTCKFLGLKTDPRSLASYPSISNCCYGCLPESVPSVVHQREFCLSENHKNCSIFAAESAIPMPSEFAHKNNGKSGSAPAFWVGILVVCLLVALILGTIFVLPDILSSQAAPEWTAPPQTENSLQTPVLNTDATEAAAITPIPSPTAMQTETPTTEPTALPQVVLLPLETKLGTSYKVIIHRVADGESLSLLAELNKTWDQAILDATYKLTLPLTIGKIIVIPVDNRSWKEHPPLEPYQVPQTAVSFDELGALLGVDAKLLKYYNGYEDYLIQQGSWIVVPRAP